MDLGSFGSVWQVIMCCYIFTLKIVPIFSHYSGMCEHLQMIVEYNMVFILVVTCIIVVQTYRDGRGI